MRVLNNPISLPFQDSETVIKRGKSEKTCITIGISGQYCTIKNQDLLLKSLKLLKINGKIDLLIIWLGFDSWNRGVNQNDLENLIASYGFPENVHTELHSVISRDNMLEKMKSCDVFVSTSYNETFGLTCLEALSLGIPVCTTQTGGCNEFMTDFNGVIVNSFEEIDFASALSDIINNLEKYDQTKIRAYALSRFSSDVYFNTIFSSGLFN
jgi:glycosyltransferase involved in cell wall biosynthesis